MSNKINAEVVVCKCGKTHQLYGMRAEEKTKNQWDLTWAFPISPSRQKNEKYDGSNLQGSFNLTEEFPGCPYCGNIGFFKCGTCGKLTCWTGEKTVTCSHCGKVSQIGGTIESLSGGGDL